MAKLILSIFTLDRGSPRIFRPDGTELKFRYAGQDPERTVNDQYETEAVDHAYVIRQVHDPENGNPVGIILEQIQYEGGFPKLREIDKLDPGDINFGAEAQTAHLLQRGIPRSVVDAVFTL